MIKYPEFFLSEEEKKLLTANCEDNFSKQLKNAASEILGDGDISYVTLSGPSCSGKTTTAKRLIAEIERSGKKVHSVSIDDFYFDRKDLISEKEGEAPDFDSVKTIDLDRLGETVSEILEHRDVYIPVYDFESGTRSGYRFLDLSPGDIIIFEGIQAVYPEVVSLFSASRFKSIYISVQDGIEIGGREFSGREVRFLRRLVRDFNHRSASPGFTYFLWESVCRNEDENMAPYAGNSDIQINSTFMYGPGVIKEQLLSILTGADMTGKYKEDVEDIISRFLRIESISPEYLSDESVYHEFIG